MNCFRATKGADKTDLILSQVELLNTCLKLSNNQTYDAFC